MKNTITIIVPIILGYILSSCGTTTGLTTAVYQDAIYQKPDAKGYIVVNTNNDKEIEVLRGKTRESNGVYVNGKLVEPLYVDEKGNIDINISGGDDEKIYLVLNPGESFEERLTKFENPQYTININFNTYDFDNLWFWDYYYNPFSWRSGRYFWSRYNYTYWNSPWYAFGRNYGYFSIDPFIGMDYFWWSNMYMPISYRPWDWYYASWHYPGSGYGYWYYNWNDPDRYRYTSSRDFYYGRRESQRSDKNNSTAVVSGGSYIRREANVEQVRGSRPYNGNLNTSESMYRRDNRFESQNGYQAVNTGRVSGNQGSQVRRQSTEIARSENGQSNNRVYTPVRRVSNEITRESGSYNRRVENSPGRESVSRGNNSSVSRGNNSSVSRNNESSYRNSGTTSSSRSGNTNTGNYRPSENQRSVNSGSSTYSRSSGSNNNSTFNSSGSRFESSSSRGYVNTSSGSTSSAGSTSSNTSSSSSTNSSGSSYRR